MAVYGGVSGVGVGKVLGSYVTDGKVFLNVLVDGVVAVAEIGDFEANILAAAVVNQTVGADVYGEAVAA